MRPDAIVEHSIPGRIRVRIRNKRGDGEFFATLVKELAAHPEIDEVRADPRTGSVVIRHEFGDEALHSLKQGQVFDLPRPEPVSPAPEAARPSPAARAATRKAFAEAESVLTPVLAGLAIMQALRGRVLGTATENFWNAYGAHRALGNAPLALAFLALGLFQFVNGRILGSASSLAFYGLVASHLARQWQTRPQ